MFHQLLSRSLLAGLALSLAVTGCATSKNLTAMEHRLVEQLQAMEARTQPQVGALKAELEQLRRAQDQLQERLTKGLSAVRNEVTATQEALRLGQVSLSELKTALKADLGQNRKAMSQYAGQTAKAIEQIAQQTTQATRELEVFRRGMMHSMLGSYQAEEAALRERLAALARARQQLESLAGPAAVEAVKPGPSPANGVGHGETNARVRASR